MFFLQMEDIIHMDFKICWKAQDCFKSGRVLFKLDVADAFFAKSDFDFFITVIIKELTGSSRYRHVIQIEYSDRLQDTDGSCLIFFRALQQINVIKSHCLAFIIELGHRIVRLGMTQEELAEALYVEKSLISYYENDKKEMRVGGLADIARVLHTTPNYLLGFADNNDEFTNEAIELFRGVKD